MKGNIKKLAVFVIIAAVVALVCACATLPPAQPVGDLKDIVGKWEGFAEYSVGGWTGSGPATLTIKESGAWESTWPKFDNNGVLMADVARYSGTGWLREGKFDIGRGHTYTLQEAGGKRLLVYAGPNASTKARLEWVQK